MQDRERWFFDELILTVPRSFPSDNAPGTLDVVREGRLVFFFGGLILTFLSLITPLLLNSEWVEGVRGQTGPLVR